MRTLPFTLLIIIILVGASLFFSGEVQASTPVSGSILSDTTWKLSNSPYLLTGAVTVAGGVTLTIEPGVIVDLNAYYITVNGMLNAQGTNGNKIIFQTSYSNNVRIQFASNSTSWNSITDSGCIIDNSVLNSVSVTITDSSPKISNNYLTNNQRVLISISGGSPLITGNSLICRDTGISDSTLGSPTISNNYIKGNGANYGIMVSNKAIISDNNITGCWVGIYCSGNSTIQANLLTSNNYGVVDTSGAATVQSNVLSNNSYGVYGGGTIMNNTLGINSVAVVLAILPTIITQNNICNNDRNIVLALSSDLDVSNNWWGTTDSLAIDKTIFDNKNSTTVGKVNFTPFLTDPNPAAPILESVNYIPFPTPTPYPTPVPITLSTPITTQPSPPPSNITLGPIQSEEPTPSATPTPSPTSLPTPTPTPKPTPGSPLIFGGDNLGETISQFDILNAAKIVLIVLGTLWAIVILVTLVKKLEKKSPQS